MHTGFKRKLSWPVPGGSRRWHTLRPWAVWRHSQFFPERGCIIIIVSYGKRFLISWRNADKFPRPTFKALTIDRLSTSWFRARRIECDIRTLVEVRQWNVVIILNDYFVFQRGSLGVPIELPPHLQHHHLHPDYDTT